MAASSITIQGRPIGQGFPAYMVAELSANHRGSCEEAEKLIESAKMAGADAVKIQTYTPDTLTLNCRTPPFMVGRGTLWEGKSLYELYQEAYTPWAWHPKLIAKAKEVGIPLFSTPFDASAVAFLEQNNVPAYKIASFELVDIPLIRLVAKTGKPMVLSTGMASLSEIDEALSAVQEEGNHQIVLLKCTSAYPAPVDEMNLRTLADMAARFDVPVGLSDHTLGRVAPVVAVSLGACLIEKHFTLSRKTPGPDSAFSLEPQEFASMVMEVREAEKALGKICYEPGAHEKASLCFRRSLFVCEDIKKGALFTELNVRSIRPADGLPPKQWAEIQGRRASQDIRKGTPLAWEFIQ